MMNAKAWYRWGALLLLGASTVGLSQAAVAARFEQQEVEQNRFIAIATPAGNISYQLTILE